MAKKGEMSIFELQKANKPEIGELCDQLITNTTLKEGMARLLELSCELKMKPCWYATNSYKCSYKGKPVVSYGIGAGSRWIENSLDIMVYISDRNEVDNFFVKQSEETINEYINNLKLCTDCASCRPGQNAIIMDKTYRLCFKGHNLCFNKPTKDQFLLIEKFIMLRREYIKNIL